MKPAFKLAIVILICQFLTACVGYIGPVYTTKTTISCKESPNNCWAVLNDRTTSRKSSQPTKKDIFLNKGEPHSIIKIEPNETWLYRNDLAWRGIAPVIIIPIPLLLPVGFNYLEYKFDNENLSSISWENGNAKTCLILIYCQ